SRRTMSNYLARAGMGLALFVPALSAGTFIGPHAAAVPGGVVSLELPGAAMQQPVVTYGGRPVLVVHQADGWRAIVGISLDTEPGEYHVDVQQPGGESRPLTFRISP